MQAGHLLSSVGLLTGIVILFSHSGFGTTNDSLGKEL